MTGRDDETTAAWVAALNRALASWPPARREAALLRLAAALAQEAAYARAETQSNERLLRLVAISAELGILADAAARDAPGEAGPRH